jgi:hypothetical protein
MWMNKVDMELRETRSIVEVEIKGKERTTTRNKRQNELRWYELQMRTASTTRFLEPIIERIIHYNSSFNNSGLLKLTTKPILSLLSTVRPLSNKLKISLLVTVQMSYSLYSRRPPKLSYRSSAKTIGC